MRFVGDFHIHSPYARATSKDMTLERLEYWAKIKGIEVLGTGDFTHPSWVKELKEKLEPVGNGLFHLKQSYKALEGKPGEPRVSQKEEVNFVLTAEVSCIYSKNGRVRKVHTVLIAPDFNAAGKINAQLGWVGNLKSDGRPILGMDAKELLKIVIASSEKCLFVPAHAWTPWFSVFGSESGFDSLEEAFEELTPYVYAIETGLSSDPAMNWRLSKLDNITLISNSDSHSLQRIGRESNVFEGDEVSYEAIVNAIRKGKRAKDGETRIAMTIEFFPEEGKYHYDGHRLCKVSLHPDETQRRNGLCPVCGKKVTIGVMNRVIALADRPEGWMSEGVIPFKRLVTLDEVIADVLSVGVGTKQVKEEYRRLIEHFENEFRVLLEAPVQELASVTLSEVAEGIARMRDGKVHVEPGYDGEYGKIKIFGSGEQKIASTQSTLF